MPAYNSAQTLRKTWDEVMAQDIVDLIIVVDDKSQDETVSIAKALPDTLVYTHEKNLGYGGNQKDLLQACTRGRRRYYHYGSSGLSVYPQINSGHDFYDRKRSLSLCARFQDSRRLCIKRRDAGLEIYCQSSSYLC